MYFARWFYGEKLSLMMDGQHSLTTRFVSMVSVMNIYGRRILRIDTPPSGLSGEKLLVSPVRGTGRTTREYIRRLV